MARRRKRPELKWGETPLDHMTPDEVLLNAKRMYGALTSVVSVARQMALQGGVYWGEGVGGAAIERGQQAMRAVDDGYTSEDIYRSYYRYADDLLFDMNKHPMIGSGWYVCPEDGTMLGKMREQSPPDSCFKCKGPMRPLAWSDLDPQQSSID